jgi:hypothetical protein
LADFSLWTGAVAVAGTPQEWTRLLSSHASSCPHGLNLLAGFSLWTGVAAIAGASQELGKIQLLSPTSQTIPSPVTNKK